MNNLALQLTNYWYIAAESAQLKEKPLAAQVIGQHLVLFRKSDGTPAVLIDRCAHRNAALSEGAVRNGCVECPYHGWQYDGEGECVRIPSIDESRPNVHKISVKQFPTKEQDGYIWVYMGNDTPLAGPRPFPHLNEANWTTFRMKTNFAAGTFSCLENFLDCPHTTHVHTGLFRSREAKPVRAEVRTSSESVEVEFFEERDAQSLVSKLLFPSKSRMVHTDRFLMPTTTRVDYFFSDKRHFIITSQCTPISENETVVYTVVTYRFGHIGRLIRLFFAPLCRRIIQQDVDVLNRQTVQLKKFGGEQFHFVESDLVGPPIIHLWKKTIRGQAVSEKSNGQAEVTKKEVRLQF